MRVAALYDIHGNLPALEAVLAAMRETGVDQVVVGGDVLSGPMQVECLERLRALPVPVDYISGNAEREVLAARAGNENKTLPGFALQMMRWCAAQLTPQLAQWIANWPKTVTLKIPPLGHVLFCHATPRDDNDIFTVRTDEALLIPIFAAAQAHIVVCGHTHMQFSRMIGKTRVVNAGSIGMPFGAPGADWLLLGTGLELRHTPYDRADAARRIARTGFPNPPEFDMLNPPAAEKMLELYEKAARKQSGRATS